MNCKGDSVVFLIAILSVYTVFVLSVFLLSLEAGWAVFSIAVASLIVAAVIGHNW